MIFIIFILFLDQPKLKNKEQVREEAVLLLEELGIKVNQYVKWDSFDISFAYYLIKINNIVKAGIAREKKAKKRKSGSSTFNPSLNLRTF